MSFNVWYGGEQVSLERIGEAIRAADPDIVGVQEADRNLARIAEVAGMPYVDPRRRLLSRWPIFDSGSGIRTATGAFALLDDRARSGRAACLGDGAAGQGRRRFQCPSLQRIR